MPFTKGHKINVGRKYSLERNRKISDSLRGKVLSEEARGKISERQKGRGVGADNPNWGGGESIHCDGRVLVRSYGHPGVNKNGYVYRSRLVMEKSLGRYLKPGETVHHKKAVDDDRRKNLRLFPSISSHLKFHRKLKSREGR